MRTAGTSDVLNSGHDMHLCPSTLPDFKNENTFRHFGGHRISTMIRDLLDRGGDNRSTFSNSSFGSFNSQNGIKGIVKDAKEFFLTRNGESVRNHQASYYFSLAKNWAKLDGARQEAINVLTNNFAAKFNNEEKDYLNAPMLENLHTTKSNSTFSAVLKLAEQSMGSHSLMALIGDISLMSPAPTGLKENARSQAWKVVKETIEKLPVERQIPMLIEIAQESLMWNPAAAPGTDTQTQQVAGRWKTIVASSKSLWNPKSLPDNLQIAALDFILEKFHAMTSSTQSGLMLQVAAAPVMRTLFINIHQRSNDEMKAILTQWHNALKTGAIHAERSVSGARAEKAYDPVSLTEAEGKLLAQSRVLPNLENGCEMQLHIILDLFNCAGKYQDQGTIEKTLARRQMQLAISGLDRASGVTQNVTQGPLQHVGLIALHRNILEDRVSRLLAQDGHLANYIEAVSKLGPPTQALIRKSLITNLASGQYSQEGSTRMQRLIESIKPA